MIRFTRLLCLVACVLLAACSSNDEKKALKPAELVDFDATIALKKLWGAKAGSGQDVRYTRFVPAVDDTTVYAADVDGGIFAFDKQTGKRKWRVSTDYPTSGAINVFDGVLTIGTYDARVIALSAQTGETLWSTDVSSEILAPPANNGQVVVAQTIDSRVFALDSKTGELRWSYDHTTPVLTLRGTSTPVMASSQVLVAFDNGQIISLSNSDGAQTWEARVSQPKGRTELERIVDIDGTPLVDGGMLYAATYHGTLAAFSRTQGRMVWQQDLSSHQNLSISKGRIFASTEEDSVVAFDAASGAILWKNDQLFLREIGAPAVLGDYVTVIDSSGYMHILSQQTGEFVYRFKPSGDGFRSPMVSYDDRLLVLSDDGVLSSYKIK